MPRTVTAYSNPLVKRVQGLRDKRHRREEGLFLAEGLRILAEAEEAGVLPLCLFFAADSAAHPIVRRLSSRVEGQGGEAIETEAVYRDLLQAIESRHDIRLRVLPDIIAGASAGGINGIFLAQAIATGQSLEPLTDLWLDKADVTALIDPGQAPQSRFTKAWAMPRGLSCSA